MKILKIFWVAFAFAFAFALALGAGSNAYAKITVDPGFTGTILVTTPDGVVKLIDASTEMPEIPSGSVLDAIDAEFVIKTEAGDSVRVDCLCNRITVASGNSVSISCANNAGAVKVMKGSSQLSSDQIGTESKILEEGVEETLVPACSASAPATADIAGQGQPAEGAPEVDSRSLESSPSR